MSESTGYSRLTVNSSNLFKRWSHRARVSTALKVVNPQPDESILDFGTGDALVLAMIKTACPASRCTGYDPFMDVEASQVKVKFPDIRLHTEYSDLAGITFDKVLCFETLEHFSQLALSDLLDQIVTKVGPSGALIVSVPIEIGPASLLKNVIRFQMNKRHSGSTLRAVLRSAIYAKDVERPPASSSGYIFSHIGFDYRVLPRMFSERGFAIVNRWFSPIGIPTDLINSQVFYQLRRS